MADPAAPEHKNGRAEKKERMALHGNPRKGRQRNGYSAARPMKNSLVQKNRGVWMEYVAKDAPKCAGITKRQG